MDRLTLPLFTLALFLSAALMFLVEPMVARMVLPRLGGTPAVWSTCLVFFQAVLLLGYGYAHGLTRYLSRRWQIGVHVAVVLPLAALSLPLSMGVAGPPPGAAPGYWLLARLALSIGPAALAISATAPLLQSWFSGMAHAAAEDPYFLYAGSNAGSLLALLAYPTLVEPSLALDRQAGFWSWGFGALALVIAACGVAAARYGRREIGIVRQEVAAIRPRERAIWVLLAFVPSSLLLGVTNHITTDIVSAPLFWVVPLAIYLVTFILVFASRPPLKLAVTARWLPFILIAVVITMAPGLVLALPVMLFLTLACLFVVGMVCHGELARRRPPAARLTEYYFLMSLGGVLGGIFNALVAPAIFPGIWEYPLILVAACAVRPSTPEDGRPGWRGDILLPLAVAAIVLVARHVLPTATAAGTMPLPLALFGFVLPGMALLNFSPRRWRFAAGAAFCLLASSTSGSGDTLTTQRSFFGVYRVQEVRDGAQQYRIMVHGTTLHGVMGLAPGEGTLPMAYYSPQGPFGGFFAATPGVPVRHVGVVGLGSGDLACYAQPGQDWTFLEIDPLVEALAREYFDFLAACGNKPRVVLGDARLTLAGVPDGAFDVLVLDAFSSDSIPMHLVTREALALYVRKLAPDGRLLFHISSRTLNLGPVLGSLAANAGLVARTAGYVSAVKQAQWRRIAARVVVMARSAGDLGELDAAHGWRDLPAGGPRSLWTDQRSDILGVINFAF